MTRIHDCIAILTGLVLVVSSAWAAPSDQLTLARELAQDGNHAGAALEYRRVAMDTADIDAQGALYWMAAYEYLAAKRCDQAERMLSKIEDVTSGLEIEVYFLRSAYNRARRKPREAAFYLESLTAPQQPAAVRTTASKKLAALRVQMHDFDGARNALQASGSSNLEDELRALTRYESGQDKSHVVGGLLGLVPGLGYAYAGEYANAARSLLLNALCIWGLVEFIEEDQWGGVALVGFAEVTFYSGSIYGGADAAVRYNRRRLQHCTDTIEGNVEIRPVRTRLPVLTLNYTF